MHQIDPKKTKFFLLFTESSKDPDADVLDSEPIEKLKNAVRDPHVLGIEDKDLIDLSVHQDKADVTSAIEVVGSIATIRHDLIVFYFCGHALPWNDELYLFVQETSTAQFVTRGLPFSEVYTQLERLNTKYLMVILDCCGGRTVLNTHKPAYQRWVSSVTAKYGRIIIVSAPIEAKTIAEPMGGKWRPAFSEIFASILDTGVKGLPLDITASRLLRVIREQAEQRNLPPPAAAFAGDIYQVSIFRNKWFGIVTKHEGVADLLENSNRTIKMLDRRRLDLLEEIRNLAEHLQLERSKINSLERQNQDQKRKLENFYTNLKDKDVHINKLNSKSKRTNSINLLL